MKRLLFLLAFSLLLFSSDAFAAYAIVDSGNAHTCKGNDGTTNNTTGNSSAINATGADLFVMIITYNTSGVDAVPTPSDSQSNTWTLAKKQEQGCTFYCARPGIAMFYVQAPAVSSSQTFKADTENVTSFHHPALCVVALSGSTASPIDQTNSNGEDTNGAVSLTTGSVTPSQSSELIVSGLAVGDVNATAQADSVLTTIGTLNSISPSVRPTGLSYQIQTTATARNPSWSWTTASDAAAVVATFKASGGGGGGATVRHRVIQ